MPVGRPRTLRRALRQWCLFFLGWLLLLLGAIVLPLPVPLGLVMLVIGSLLVISTSPRAAWAFQRIRSHYPKFNARIVQLQPRLPGWTRSLLQSTAPEPPPQGKP